MEPALELSKRVLHLFESDNSEVMYTGPLCLEMDCKRMFTVLSSCYTGQNFKLLIFKGRIFAGDWHAICNN